MFKSYVCEFVREECKNADRARQDHGNYNHYSSGQTRLFSRTSAESTASTRSPRICETGRCRSDEGRARQTHWPKTRTGARRDLAAIVIEDQNFGVRHFVAGGNHGTVETCLAGGTRAGGAWKRRRDD